MLALPLKLVYKAETAKHSTKYSREIFAGVLLTYWFVTAVSHRRLDCMSVSCKFRLNASESIKNCTVL